MRRSVVIAVWMLLVACGDDGASSPPRDAMTAPVDAATASDADVANDANVEHDAHVANDANVEHDAAEPDAAGPPFRLPPDNGGFDYQLGGGYDPPAGVMTVARDRTDTPAPGLYNICYVNGFQVQPGEDDVWDEDLILRDAQGEPVIDEDWDEALLDVSTPEKRVRIATVIGGFIEGCADDGFDAVEIDNLDSYTRSGDRLTQDDAVATVALFAARAHALGLAIAQKNSTELLERRAEMGTDFAVAEECGRYAECGDYVFAYGQHVLMIEYREQDFASVCAAFMTTHAVVLRDLDLVTPDDDGYVFDGC